MYRLPSIVVATAADDIASAYTSTVSIMMMMVVSTAADAAVAAAIATIVEVIVVVFIALRSPTNLLLVGAEFHELFEQTNDCFCCFGLQARLVSHQFVHGIAQI